MRAALLLFALPLLAQQGPCTIQGTALRTGDNAPVPRARIFLRSTNPQTPIVLGYFSGDAGTFLATGLDPAAYTLAVRRRGLIAAPDSPSSINLSRNCHVTGLTLSLTPAAVLSGRVSAPPGLPASGIRVEAQRRAWFNGRWQYRTIAAVNAGAGGEYRISNLPAGAYLLRAWPATPQTVSFREPGGPDQSVSPSYYPSVYSPAQARQVTVESGQESPGLDFSLLLASFVRVAGRVLSVEGLKAPAACSVSLRSIPPALTIDARYNPADGTYLFPEVPSGEYDLLAYSVETATIGSATRRIEVAANDIEGFDIPLDPPFTVKAKVKLPNGVLPDSGLRVRLHPLTLRGVEEEPVDVAQDGAVEFSAFLKDRYRVEFTSDRPDIYLKDRKSVV